MTDFGGKTCIFSHPVYLFLREFSLQDFRGGLTFITTPTIQNGRRGISKRKANAVCNTCSLQTKLELLLN
ncbi:hypothetical protein GBE31_23965 [Escherichia coli]|nr:hypothetical protein [Escherichia coli]